MREGRPEQAPGEDGRGMMYATTPMGKIHYRLEGPAGAPLLILAPSLGTSTEVWRDQVAAFAGRWRLVLYDHPGHGGEKAPAGPYTISGLAGEVLALMDALGEERASICGLSLGGMVAMWLAAHHPQRVEGLVLAATAPALPPPDAWNERAASVRGRGTGHLLDALMGRWFTGDIPSPGRARSFVGSMLEATDPEGYASCCEAIASCDLWQDVTQIAAPTLVIGGADDPVATPRMLTELAAAIPHAALTVIPRAAHLVNVEAAEPFSEAVMGHLLGVPRQRGRRLRTEVLGERHVRAREASATPFTGPFQDFIARSVWGDVWTRPGLSREVRRLLALAMLAALGHTEELGMHVRAAVRAGVSEETISEVLLQVAAYAGVPAANAAFRAAEGALAEEERGEEGG